MNFDTVWQVLRYALIFAGSFAAGKGWASNEDVTALVGAICTIVPIAWGIYVKAGTTAVPDATAARADVPTVSAVTGQTSIGPGR